MERYTASFVKRPTLFHFDLNRDMCYVDLRGPLGCILMVRRNHLRSSTRRHGSWVGGYHAGRCLNLLDLSGFIGELVSNP